MNTNTLEDKRFNDWMFKVDLACYAQAGVSVNDLPDYCFRDEYDDGASPSGVARRAIRAGGGE